MSISISLQSSAGRFELLLEPTLSLREVKRAFRKKHAELAEVNMNAFALVYRGVFLTDDGSTLADCRVDDGAVLLLLRRRAIPSLNPREDAE